MAPPTLILVPGSYSSPLFYIHTANLIHKRLPDWPEMILLDLPSASSAPPLHPPDLFDDAAYCSKQIGEHVDKGEDVVLFAHSYGGAVARESIKGHSKEERAKAGKAGGVIKIIFLSSVILEPGTSVTDAVEPFADQSLRMLRPLNEGSTDYYRHGDIALSAALCFSDMPQKEGIKWSSRMTIHTGTSFASKATELSELDRSIPSTYILLTEDKVLPLQFQKERVEILEKESGKDKVSTVEMETGHCPVISAPEELADVIVDILRA